ncbi:MAG: quinate 5-dehydrogenase [Clostridia bacterium]|nr:quinate 5-dehydrogenase [Clostridia bacterium]
MKRVVSVSVGSSTRNDTAQVEILGTDFLIERIGTDGDFKKAVEIIQELDGKVDAFGLGGLDVHLHCKNRKYTIRPALPLINAAKTTPVVDGSGLKNTLERKLIDMLIKEQIVDFKGKKVLVVSGMDRFGMSEALVEAGCDTKFGDLIFALKVPLLIKNLNVLNILAITLMPILSRLPFEVLYPTGKKQEQNNTSKYEKFYNYADIIAGDFIYIKKYMPEDMKDKIIITNTVTSKDLEELKKRHVKMLITSTPNLNGRSFGTNVMEAVLVALSGKKPEELTADDYIDLLRKIDFKPRIERLN